MNAVARAQLTFQTLTLLQKYLYRQSQYSKTWDSKCLALRAQMFRAFGVNLGGSSPPQVETFHVSKTFGHFHKNTRSCVENEWCCPRTVTISNFTLLQEYQTHLEWCTNCKILKITISLEIHIKVGFKLDITPDEIELNHYSDVITSVMASRITSVSIVYSSVCSGADQRKHHSSASLAFMRGIHRWPANSPHKGPITRKMFPFDDVIMYVGHFTKNIIVACSSAIIFKLHCMATLSHDDCHIGFSDRLSQKYNSAIPKSVQRVNWMIS